MQAFYTFIMCEDYEESDLVVVAGREAKYIHFHQGFLEHLEKRRLVRGRQTRSDSWTGSFITPLIVLLLSLILFVGGKV